ncbi:hypothetical protein [Belnapia rosea]|uniref:hypothetical protein n=1 Tax=Belnapia rosea TaxID=938405 RepID=UPI00088A91B3|nr:hypothetical protein [Belnapia rosea]SDB74559.1 hypothetical protein SAMN02927895_05274 [Belnapia rosea]
MNVEEFQQWQRGEPDLHELMDGKPIRLADEKQVTRRIFRVLAVAANAYRSKEAGRKWLEAEQPELGAKPIDLAAEGWEGVLSCLRFLAAAVPGCTRYTPSKAPFRIGPAQDLLEEAERYAAILRHRRGQATALIAALNIFDGWQLSGSQQRAVLGLSDRAEFEAVAHAAHGYGAVVLEPDVLLRTGAVAAIHAALKVRYDGEHERLGWLRASNASAAFGGGTPMGLITARGMEDLLVVLGFLEATKMVCVSTDADHPVDKGA